MADTIPHCPVLHPTAKQFNNFRQYMQRIDKQYSKNFGMVQIVTPKGYQARASGYDKSIQNVMIPGPIEQNFYGKGGIYEALLIQKKSLLMKDYRKKSENFDHVTEGLSLDEAEDLFWKNISFSPPLYGADVFNSLFDDNAKWNLNYIPSLLSDGIENQISGVNTPYLYIGAWKTVFAWHQQDLDLPAINYLHYGKTKFWYAISPDEGCQLETMAQQHFSEAFAKCSEFMRHKTIVLNPYLVKRKFPDLQIHQIDQNPGDFIIVFPGAYHSGFNHGFNIAEAVNFATLSWLGRVLNTQPCRCTSDNVKINPSELLENLLQNPQYSQVPEVLAFQKEVEERNKKENINSKAHNHSINGHQQQQNQKDLKEIAQEKKEESPRKVVTKQISQDNHINGKSQLEKHKRLRQEVMKKKMVFSPTNVEKISQVQNSPVRRSRSKDTEETKDSYDSSEYDLIEKWFCCDLCNKWRKIVDRQTAKAIEKRPKFFCENLVGITCQKEEENYQGSITLNNNSMRRSERIRK